MCSTSEPFQNTTVLLGHNVQVPTSFPGQKGPYTGLEDSPDQFVDDRYIHHYVIGLSTSVSKQSLLTGDNMILCKSFSLSSS